MPHTRKSLAILLLAAVFPAEAFEAYSEENKASEDPARSELTYYVTGHSLFNWAAGTEPGSTKESKVGYWLGDLAQQSGTKTGSAGQWGQLDYHAVPYVNIWGKAETDAHKPWLEDWLEKRSFGEMGFSHLIFMPANFVQNWFGPDREKSLYKNHLIDTYRVVDYSKKEVPSIEVILYEHWPKPDMAGNVAASKELTASEFEKYRKYASENYHSWFLSYQNDIADGRPEYNLRMIPVGPVIMDLISTEPYLEKFREDSGSLMLFVDEAPHGTRNMYLLAAMVTYRALFLQNPNTDYSPDEEMIHPDIANNIGAIIEFIEKRLDYYEQNGTNVYN